MKNNPFFNRLTLALYHSTNLFSKNIHFNNFCTKCVNTAVIVNDNTNKSKISLDLNLSNLLAECPDKKCLFKQDEVLTNIESSNTNTLPVEAMQNINLIKFNEIKLLTELGLPENYELIFLNPLAQRKEISEKLKNKSGVYC